LEETLDFDVPSLRVDEKMQSNDIRIKAMKPTEDTFNLVYFDGEKKKPKKKKEQRAKKRKKNEMVMARKWKAVCTSRPV
jgi:hypothetical protein